MKKIKKDSTVRRGCENIVRMSAFQTLALMRNRDVTADQYRLDEGRMINGQKVLIEIIAGTAGLAVIAMHKLFRRLAA